MILLVVVGVLADVAPRLPDFVEKADPAKLGMIWPVEGHPDLLGFGSTENFAFDAPGFHGGINISSPAGTVVFAGEVPPYGTLAIIEHDKGLRTWYSPLFRPKITKGDEVTQGQIIGQVDRSSYSPEYHLHFEVHLENLHLDPPAFLPDFED
ncbi:M23 family metallopeptidase [bacterium]|nr:M23 family metallopeptidase [bacterium]